MKWYGSFEGVFFKQQFDFFIFTTSREGSEYWLAKTSALSFRDLSNKLSIPAALDGSKPFKIFHIASGDI